MTTFFFFQAVFAATAVTITSGAMAERTKFVSYLIFGAFMCAIIYPVVVHMDLGRWLHRPASRSATPSTPTSPAPAWSTSPVASRPSSARSSSALARASTTRTASLGRSPATHPVRHPGCVHPVARLVRLQPRVGTRCRQLRHAGIAVNTMLAAAAGGLATTAVIWLKTGKPDVAMIGNGVLAGLVAITGPCGAVTPVMSIIIGAIGGVLVVFSVLFFDKLKIDDPVGAISVHGVVGAWGLLAIGLFASKDDAFLGRAGRRAVLRRRHRPTRRPVPDGVIIIVWVGIDQPHRSSRHQVDHRPAGQCRRGDRGTRRSRARPPGLRPRHRDRPLID